MCHHCSYLSLSQAAGPLGARARPTPPRQTEQNRESQQQQCLYLLLCLGHTAQFLGACQDGLLSGSVCLWGERCPGVGSGVGGSRARHHTRQPAWVPEAMAHEVPGRGAKGLPTLLSAGSDDQELPPHTKTSQNHCPPSPRPLPGSSLSHPCTPTLTPNSGKVRKVRDTG